VAGSAWNIVGRERELGSIARFLDDVPSGPAALLIEGEAGIGKTTLWQAGVARAQALGLGVLTTRAGQSEARLAFTALGDLLGPIVDEMLPALPDPQRSALEVALLRIGSIDPAPDPRAVSLAALAVLLAAVSSRPLVICIDDLQWLDASSARVLEFCFRRARGEPIGLLASSRLGSDVLVAAPMEQALPGERVRRLTVGPMPPDELGRVIRGRLDAELPHPVVRRIHEAADGNPFFAVEIAREIGRRGGPSPGERLPVPQDLTELLTARVGALPKASRSALLVAASAFRPTVDLVRATSDLGDRAVAALSKAESAGVIEIEEGAIRFVHPLLASATSGSATAEQRRRVHRRLADHIDEPEERARHLALSSHGPDPEIAAALDEAARHARARGAPDAAAELAELARRLTLVADVDALCGRTLLAAENHFDSGDVARSTALFEEAIASVRPGGDRARILFRLASHSWMDLRRVQTLCEQALREAPEDPALLAAIHEHLAWVGIYRGDLAGASEHAQESMERVQQSTQPANRAEATATFGMVEFLLGRPAQAIMAEAERLEDLGAKGVPVSQATVYTPARTNHGLQLLWAGELDAARETIQQELSGYERAGLYLIRDEPLGYLAELECRAGNWDIARRHAEEAYEIQVESGRLSGLGHTLFNKALVEAHRGEVDAARSDAEEGLRISLENDDPFYASCNRHVLGFLELSLSNPSRAMEHLEPVVTYLQTMGAAEPGVIPCVPDAIEALVSLGELDEAEAPLEEHAAKGRAQERAWAIASARRCRGLLLAAGGDLDGARDALDSALEEHGRLRQPFELGRTLIVKGEVERRAKQKAAARASVEHALRIFDGLGARLWSDRARAELERVGGPAVAPGELTPTERRVADLVAEGKTNREVAASLFISVKTVEANVSRIFRKLGVRSRVELARRLGRARSEDSEADA